MTLPVTIALLALWSLAMYRYGRSVLFPPASVGDRLDHHALRHLAVRRCVFPPYHHSQ